MMKVTSRSSEPAAVEGRWRLKVGTKQRIAAASATAALLMLGAFVFTFQSHRASVEANLQAHIDRSDALLVERAVSVFWQEREAMGEFLAFPHPSLTAELLEKRLLLEHTLHAISAESRAELVQIGQAKAANERLVAIFQAQSTLAGAAGKERQALRLHNAEAAVLESIEQLRVGNRRDHLRAEASANAAEQTAYRSGIFAALLGFAAIGLFALFAFGQVQRIDRQNVGLQAADKVKDEFIGTVSHELRTPLTSIHGYVELLLDETGEPLTKQETRTFLETVRRGTIRLERLVSDLLLAAQVREGQLELQKTSTDVVEIARESVEAAQTEANRKSLHLSLTATSDSILADADALRIAQAVDNLISNAIKFTPDNGRVDVALAQDGGNVTLTVADTGMGMTAADVDRLFERFFRTDAAQAHQIQGTGLGLPIVKAIVEAHDGTITVTSKPNIGTSFVISLPLASPFERTIAAPADRLAVSA